MNERVIILLDADCFGVQVWTKGDPSLEGQPVVATFSNNYITAANYPAKEFGITRGENLAEALGKCPQLVNKQIPDRWGKPEQKNHRKASYDMYNCLKRYRIENKFEIFIEFSAYDEFYMDISKVVTKRIESLSEFPSQFYLKTVLETEEKLVASNSTNVSDFLAQCSEGDLRLFVGGIIAGEIVEKVKSETGLQTSAGVSGNRLLAKIACGMHKPASVTILTDRGLSRAAQNIDVESMPTLGGKLGQQLKNECNLHTMADLRGLTEKQWKEKLGEKRGGRVHELAWGIDRLNVPEKSIKENQIICKRVSCTSSQELMTTEDIIESLAEEMVERLEEELELNGRKPVLMKIQLLKIQSAIENTEKTSERFSSEIFDCSENVTHEEIADKSMKFLSSFLNKNGNCVNFEYIKLIAHKFKFLEQ